VPKINIGTLITGIRRTVPQQYSTIQSAIKASSNGDTVLVSEGTYYENINFLGKAITVASTFLTTGDTSHISRTIIDGSKPSNSDSGSVVYFISGEDTNSVLCGFTITGGTGTYFMYGGSYARAGGGVFCQTAGARLTKNIIARNGVYATLGFGGGLAAENFTSSLPILILEGNYIKDNLVKADSAGSGGGYSGGADIIGTSARIVNNVFEKDSAIGTNYAMGGGLNLWGANETGPFPEAYIHSNIFRANIVSATNKSAWAGGLYICWTGNTVISENIFEGNIVTSGLSSVHGGGICIDEYGIQNMTRKKVLRNRFVSNRIIGQTVAEGGGIVIGYTLVTLDGNEFVDNVVVAGSGGYYAGGGIRAWMSSFRMENNIVTRNSASVGGGIEVANPPSQGTEQVIMNNTIFDNNATTGGGLLLTSGANAVLLNNIFWGDTASSGKEISLSSSTGNINYCNIQGGWSGGMGNINVDPQFVLLRIDSLQARSACIGAGRDTMTIGGILYAAPKVDFHGHPRPQPAGSRPDIGAEESPLAISFTSLAISPEAIDFGAVTVGRTSDTIVVTVKNRILQSLTINSITVGKSTFTLSALPVFPLNLAPSDSLKFGVTFKPSNTGDVTDKIVVTSNDVSAPVMEVALSGRAILVGPQTWNLVWSDEFDSASISKSNWTYDTGGGGWGNGELEYYTNRSENSSISNGNLLIVARKESYSGSSYTSARLKTQGLKSFTYGKIEARMKLPVGQGLWPAFWLLGNNISQVNWPRCGEIDIMEHINTDGNIYGTMHWDNNGYVSYGGGTTTDNVGAYHIYSIEWSADAIKWFLDGNQYWEGNISNNINGTDEFHLPFFIILNVAVGGRWPGSPDSTTYFPDTMFVDYVRVYQPVSNGVGEERGDVPARFTLEQNFPNPFNPSTVISYQLPGNSYVTLKVYDLLGREVTTLVNERKDAGRYSVQWNAANLSSGIYFYQLQANGRTEIRKAILMK
jgi:beta-glucanase (GH16 family)